VRLKADNLHLTQFSILGGVTARFSLDLFLIVLIYVCMCLYVLVCDYLSLGAF